MTKENVIIRLERKEEYREVESLVRESFWNIYRPGCLEHYVLHKLRDDKDFIRELDFVMEKDNVIIGQVAFMKAKIETDEGNDIQVLTIGPICISIEFQRKGYGKILLDYSLLKAKELGYNAIFLEGDIIFYEKIGFDYAKKYNIRYHGLDENEDTAFFLCKELIPGCLNSIKGEYSTPIGYFVDEKEVEDFDKEFPYKEKKKLPGQLF